MNFVAICLHCLDMRDFHSALRRTPFLDELRTKSVFVPHGRAQGHHQADSLNAEMTGVWTGKYCDSELAPAGYTSPERCWLPKTVLESLQEHDYELLTCIDFDPKHQQGSYAVPGGMESHWLKHEPDRLRQFAQPHPQMSRKEWLERIQGAKRFYAHVFLRETHRPWLQVQELYALLGWRSRAWCEYRRRRKLLLSWPYDAYVARRAALEQPDGFAALRRKGLEMADRRVTEIFAATRHRDDVTYIVYSNHGEVLDHFRYNQPYRRRMVQGLEMVEGTSHGSFPYEVLYANMQMWLIPGQGPRVMRGMGRLIDYAPTVLDLAGIRPSGMDGESMLPLFTDGVFPPRERLAETPMGGGCLSMVREDGYKLLSLGRMRGADPDRVSSSGFAAHRLAVFDLRADPYEYVNLIDTPQGQDVLAWALARHAELVRARTPPA